MASHHSFWSWTEFIQARILTIRDWSFKVLAGKANENQMYPKCLFLSLLTDIRQFKPPYACEWACVCVRVALYPAINGDSPPPAAPARASAPAMPTTPPSSPADVSETSDTNELSERKEQNEQKEQTEQKDQSELKEQSDRSETVEAINNNEEKETDKKVEKLYDIPVGEYIYVYIIVKLDIDITKKKNSTDFMVMVLF